ncbi:MAG: hypothetical protein CVU58_01025 [Deltaproteobacteria bacterium HGW-Deltaproteobacteria-16]|nr:MAG: hypothetical protein CVU58_01025 [Deltaproteobacteria bacterium HGW-Deltaproteobacteria-16]
MVVLVVALGDADRIGDHLKRHRAFQRGAFQEAEVAVGLHIQNDALGPGLKPLVDAAHGPDIADGRGHHLQGGISAGNDPGHIGHGHGHRAHPAIDQQGKEFFEFGTALAGVFVVGVARRVEQIVEADVAVCQLPDMAAELGQSRGGQIFCRPGRVEGGVLQGAVDFMHPAVACRVFPVELGQAFGAGGSEGGGHGEIQHNRAGLGRNCQGVFPPVPEAAAEDA